ncbi:hypothetical protein K523DRAFT_373682 [Schizophyllum commune Tattone D]|nr:hypothetical protein K523DRAFT_373682 [Schizophyllum commune Tattone D]
MHPAFNIAELCFMIARTDALHRPDLCCLALVCRHWRDVAEAVLWENVPDFDHLLMLMPSDVWSFKISRALKPSAWDPLLRKSLLVRKLTMHTNDIPRLLSSCRSLQELIFEANTRHVRIGFTGELIDALHAISRRLAVLRLSITFKFPWSEGGHDIFLQRVSRFSSLVSLELNFFDNHQDDFESPTVYTTPGFASLEELTLRGGYARTLVDIICSAPRRAMRRIDVKFASLDAADLEPICRALNTHCVHDVLRELYLHTWSSSGQISLQSFRPLEAFDALEFRYLDWICSLVARDNVLGSADLARLALVSRIWRDAAEEVLWADLPDVLCQLRLLPEDLWYMETEPSTDGSYHSEDELRVFKLRRELRPTDWASLLPKSGLVKILTVATSLSAEVQQAIIGCPPPLKVLPRLETLCLAKSTNPTFLGAFVPLDTITTLRITHSGASLHSSTASLLNSCANVTSLTLKLHLVGASKQTKAVALLTAVTEAKRVQRLSLLLTMEFALPSERFMHFISQIPALTNLDIRLNRCEGAKDYLPIAYGSPSFVHLRTLKLSRHSTQMPADILRASSPSHLRVIDLMYFALEEADVEPLISTICTYCARSALRKLSIAASNFFGSTNPRYLAPLAAFEQLEVHFMDRAIPFICQNLASSIA